MRISKKFTIFSWSMYDFANTIFSMNVISLYFPLLIIVNMKKADIVYSSALSGSMLFAALSAPIFGAISDRLGRRMPFLIILTLFCCVFTACIGLSNQMVSILLCFIIANYCYQLADIFYNTLLPEISDRKQMGRTSGYGVGLGYGGTIAGLLLTRFFFLKYGVKATFIPTAFFFFLFALPCFLFVKDRKINKARLDLNILPESFSKIKNTLKNIERHAELFTFLIAAFIILNVVNTVIVFMSVYTKQVIEFTDSQVNIFYIISSVFAIMGSLFSGFMTDKMGPKRTLSGALLLWCITILLAIFATHQILFWLIGLLAGISLGATWTSARTLVARLSPPYMFGEVFGFYGLVGKSASIVGPMIWGFSVLVFEPLGVIKYRISVFVLLLFLIIGFFILQKVPSKVDRG